MSLTRAIVVSKSSPLSSAKTFLFGILISKLTLYPHLFPLSTRNLALPTPLATLDKGENILSTLRRKLPPRSLIPSNQTSILMRLTQSIPTHHSLRKSKKPGGSPLPV